MVFVNVKEKSEKEIVIEARKDIEELREIRCFRG